MSKNILIVDDSRVSRMMISKIIHSKLTDSNIIEAENGDDALAKSADQAIDLMVLDYNMPGITGLELGSQLRASHPESKIWLLTANIQESIQKQAAELGILFQKKPVTEDKILGILKTL